MQFGLYMILIHFPAPVKDTGNSRHAITGSNRDTDVNFQDMKRNRGN